MKRIEPNFLTCPIEKEPPKPRMERSEDIEHRARSTGHAPPEASGHSDEFGTGHVARGAQKRVWPWILGVFLILLVTATLGIGVGLGSAYVSARSVKARIGSAMDAASNRDFQTARSDTAAARLDLRNARVLLSTLRFLRDAPGIGTQIRAVEDATGAADQLLGAADDILGAALAIQDALAASTEAAFGGAPIPPHRRFRDLTTDEKRSVLQAFASALPSFRIARDKVDVALELWNRVSTRELISPLRSAFEPLASGLPTLKRAMDDALPLMELMVPLAGVPQERRYLVLLQNADELRPGGGFIGNIGTALLSDGNIESIDVRDVYDVDHAVESTWKDVPPKPMAEQLGVKAWYLRDANWSPDFPTSAQRALDSYIREVELATKTPLRDAPTTVVALEPAFFASLLGFLGPVAVEGKAFTAADFFDKLQYEVEQGFLAKGIPVSKRKDLVEQLGFAVMDKMMDLPAYRWPALLTLVQSAFTRKHMVLYAADAELQRVVDRYGWSGRAKPTDGDFLWVVDANLAALKTDRVMDKRVLYQLDASDPEHPIATVTLSYHNTAASFDYRTTRYRSYTRVYVPEGSELIESSGAPKDQPDVFRELGKTVFGAFWIIEPKETKTLRFRYRLPPSAIRSATTNAYRLDWPKQIGADETKLTLDLSFGTTIRSASPPEHEKAWGDAKYEYQTDSLEDRTFLIAF